MKDLRVNLYKGCFSLVKKSGVGQAILHQRDMLKNLGVEITDGLGCDADIAQFNTIFPDSFLAAVMAHIRGMTVVYYAHSTAEDFRNSFKLSNAFAPFFKWWITRCYNRGDVIITPTDYSKKLLRSYGIRKPIYNLSNGVDTEFFAPSDVRRAKFRARHGLRPGDKAVMSVGHYIERKGLPEFVELARRMPDFRFFWFGYTDLKLVPDNIRAAIANAPSNLTFPGYVGREELREAYNGCDLFTFMSKEETEGIVVLEALACGVPAVVRDIPVYRSWLEDGVNVYKAVNFNDFAAKVPSILDGSLPDLTDMGLEVAESRSIREIGRRLMSIYKSECDLAGNKTAHIAAAPEIPNVIE